MDIYSCSWGPDDNGFEVAEAGVMTEEVLRKGTLEVKQCHHLFLSYFFLKKYLLLGTSSMLWTGQLVSESVSERCMYVTPIRLDLL